MLRRYLNWKGLKTEVFNAGDYRRHVRFARFYSFLVRSYRRIILLFRPRQRGGDGIAKSVCHDGTRRLDIALDMFTRSADPVSADRWWCGIVWCNEFECSTTVEHFVDIVLFLESIFPSAATKRAFDVFFLRVSAMTRSVFARIARWSWVLQVCAQSTLVSLFPFVQCTWMIG